MLYYLVDFKIRLRVSESLEYRYYVQLYNK